MSLSHQFLLAPVGQVYVVKPVLIVSVKQYTTIQQERTRADITKVRINLKYIDYFSYQK